MIVEERSKGCNGRLTVGTDLVGVRDQPRVVLVPLRQRALIADVRIEERVHRRGDLGGPVCAIDVNKGGIPAHVTAFTMHV